MNSNPFDLRQLIANEDDPKLRVLLMLVNTFNENLAANTIAVEANAQAVNGIATKLDNHLVTFEERAAREDALRNQGKGAWRVLAWVLGIVQVVGLGIWVEAKREISGIHEAIVTGQATDIKTEAKANEHEGRLRALEKRP